MAKSALFVRHRAKSGQRDRVRSVWEKYVQPRVRANAAHEAYYFCFEDSDPDVICVFQLFSDQESVTAFMSGDWYSEYLEEVSEFIADAPQINCATPQWIKRPDGP
jgi:quinol monooxygenase YgiN